MRPLPSILPLRTLQPGVTRRSHQDHDVSGEPLLFNVGGGGQAPERVGWGMGGSLKSPFG